MLIANGKIQGELFVESDLSITQGTQSKIDMFSFNDYSLLEYIESTGTQFIDTGYKITPNTRVVADWQYTDLEAQSRIFGVRNNPTFEAYISGYGANSVAWKDGNGQWVSSGSNVDMVRRTYDLDGSTKTYKIDNGDYANLSLASYSITVPVHAYSLYLFATNNLGVLGNIKDSYVPAKGKMYSFKIYESTVLKKSFVPVRRKIDSVVGLFDLIEKKFYSSGSTTTFIAGNAVEVAQQEGASFQKQGYKVFNINDFVNYNSDSKFEVTIQGQGFTLSKHPTDDELYIISYTGDSIQNGKLLITASDNQLEIPITNKWAEV